MSAPVSGLPGSEQGMMVILPFLLAKEVPAGEEADRHALNLLSRESIAEASTLFSLAWSKGRTVWAQGARRSQVRLASEPFIGLFRNRGSRASSG